MCFVVTTIIVCCEVLKRKLLSQLSSFQLWTILLWKLYDCQRLLFNALGMCRHYGYSLKNSHSKRVMSTSTYGILSALCIFVHFHVFHKYVNIRNLWKKLRLMEKRCVFFYTRVYSDTSETSFHAKITKQRIYKLIL